MDQPKLVPQKTTIQGHLESFMVDLLLIQVLKGYPFPEEGKSWRFNCSGKPYFEKPYSFKGQSEMFQLEQV